MKKEIFYIQKYCYINSAEEVDITAIPPLQRRKLSPVDKIALYVMDKVFEPDVKEIVFASRYGEFTRLKTIIEQYSEMNEVSPAQFSGSVHNYPAGFFTLYKKLNIPYYAIASAENTLSSGLVKSVLSNADKTLFCYADKVGTAAVVSQNEGGIKCRITNGEDNNSDEFSNFIDFLEGKTHMFNSRLCKIERIN